MKKILFISLILAACSKKDSTTQTTNQATDFSSFVGKTLICDSVKTVQNGSSTTTVVGQGRGLDIMYSASTYTVYSNPQVVNNYKYEAPNKHYYWAPGNSLQSDMYYTFSMSGNKLITYQVDPPTNKVITNYYHY